MCTPDDDGQATSRHHHHPHPIGTMTRAEALSRRSLLTTFALGLGALAGYRLMGAEGALAQPAALPSGGAAEAAARIAAPFGRFAPDVATRSDGRYFYVESHGMPNHPLMIGIKAWQQQVPIPQDYSGTNAWRFPLFPTPAAKPLSARESFFRGAIAIAADGIPIFNPIKTDGHSDTYLGGELDEFGGHSGRSDDYHYHVAPMFLAEVLGEAVPIAYALDGYPIFGPSEVDGTPARDLDAFNGHAHDGSYHYHASPRYPYLNGGFHGEIGVRDGEVDPQPRASAVRPATNPLRGATIVGFERRPPDGYALSYRIGADVYAVNYRVDGARNTHFEFVDASGRVRVEDYAVATARRRR
jgi:hypothetical protein